jgi:hypothetical protein
VGGWWYGNAGILFSRVLEMDAAYAEMLLREALGDFVIDGVLGISEPETLQTLRRILR